MKSFTFLIAFLCLMVTNLSAQDASKPLQAQLDYAVAELDFSAVSSGFLIDKAHSLVELEQLNGTRFSSTNRTIRGVYELAYAGISSSAIRPNEFLPSFDEYRTRMDRYERAGPMAISLMAIDYHKFDPQAIENDLLEFRDGQFRDLAKRNENPYQTGQLFAATLGYASVETQEVEFILPSDLIFSNHPSSSIKIEIDFDDGQDWRVLNHDQKIAISYPSEGVKEISIRCTLRNGDSFVTQTVLRVERASEALSTKMFNATPDRAIELEGVTMYVYYNNDCAEQSMIKPFIFVEGFDPFGTTNFQQFNALISQDYSLPSGRTLKDEVHEGGYDLVFVNFHDGGENIPQNAEYIKSVIREVNARKAAVGSTEENVLLGVSMGGVVLKWALREMERDPTENHESRLLISFDSPFRGANIALGFQATIRALALHQIANAVNLEDISFSGGTNPLKEGREKLNSPAARNLLYYHIESPGNYQAWHDAFYNQLWALGDLEIKHVAVVNGSVTGVGQLFDPGALLLDEDLNTSELLEMIFTEDNGENDWTEILPDLIDLMAEVRWKMKAWALAGGGSQTVFEGEFREIILGIPFLEVVETTAPGGLLPLDSAPGGMRPFIRVEPGQNTLNFDWNYYSFCFIPTFSALDIDTDNIGFDFSNQAAVVGSGATQISAYVGAIEPTFQWGPPFDDLSPTDPLNPLQDNQEHGTYIDRRIASFISYHTLGDVSLDGLSSITNRIYNFGASDELISLGPNGAPNTTFPPSTTRPFIDNNLFVYGGGQVWINRLGKIGFTDEAANLNNAVGSNFAVAIRKGCEAGTTVTIANGGLLDVGQSENTGPLTVEEGSSLWIRAGGRLVAEEGSKIVVKSGATLVMGANSELGLLGDAEIIIEQGGEMRIYEGSTINLEGNDSRIQVQGWLTVKGAFDFPGRGYFKFSETNRLVLEAEFRLDGRGKGHRFIHLDWDAALNIEGGKLNLRNGKVVYFPGSSIQAGGDSEVRFWYTEFSGSGVGLRARNSSLINIRSSDFINLEDGVIFENVDNPGQTVNLLLANFQTCKRGLTAYRCGSVALNTCQFNGGNEANFGVYAESVGSLSFNNSTLGNYSNDGAAAIRLVDALDVRINGGRIEGSYYGIHCPDGSWENLPSANILLKGTATIEDNAYGIYIERGGLSHGNVTMDCARLINNYAAGIKGVDVGLNIDACQNNNSPNCQGNFRPNHFAGGAGSGSTIGWAGRYFEICYEQRSVTNIPARGNYWEWQGNPHGQRYAIGSSGGGLCYGTQLDMSFAQSSAPVGCGGVITPGDGGEIGPQREATTDPISNPDEQNNELLIYPNPATADFEVEITAENFFLEVFNATGQRVWTSEAVWSIKVPTTSWPRGIYVVRATLNNGTSVLQRRLVVQ